MLAAGVGCGRASAGAVRVNMSSPPKEKAETRAGHPPAGTAAGSRLSALFLMAFGAGLGEGRGGGGGRTGRPRGAHRARQRGNTRPGLGLGGLSRAPARRALCGGGGREGGRRLLGPPRGAPAPRSRVAKSAGRRFKAASVCAPCLPVEKVASSPASAPCCALGRGSVCGPCPGLSQQLAIPPRDDCWLSGSIPSSATEAALHLHPPLIHSLPGSSLLAHTFRPGRRCF